MEGSGRATDVLGGVYLGVQVQPPKLRAAGTASSSGPWARRAGALGENGPPPPTAGGAGQLVGPVGEAAGDHGEDRLAALQVGRVGREHVAREHGQVGPLAGLDG